MVKLVERFEHYGSVEGYLASAKKTYDAMRLDYKTELGVVEVENRLLFQVELTVYDGQRGSKSKTP